MALASRNDSALEQACQFLDDVNTYTDYSELLNDSDVEAVVIATPNWLHADQAMAAFEAGKHVFCEKPSGINVWEEVSQSRRNGAWALASVMRTR